MPDGDGILFADPVAVRARQEANFAATLDHVFAGHPYYRDIFARSGLQRADMRGLDDLVRIPATRKADYLERHQEFVLSVQDGALEESVVWETLYTTGSTGRPTPFVSTSHDFYNILTTYRRMLTMRGVGQGDILANLYPITQYPQGAYVRVMNAASALHIPVISLLPGRPSPAFRHGSSREQVAQAIATHGVTAVWGVPSFVRLVLRTAADLGIRFPRLRHLLVSGEELPEAGRANLVEAAAAVGASATVRASYGATEMQGGFVECTPGAGFHNPAPEEFWLEILDPATHAPLPDGEEGLVAITHLNRRGTVLLRYLIGDVAARSREPCPHCGATVDRIVSRLRRADSLVKVKGMLVNPAVLDRAMEADPCVLEHQFRLCRTDPSDPFSMDELELAVSLRPDTPAAHDAALTEAVKHAVGVTPRIVRVSQAELVDPGRAWKAKRFVDLRNRPTDRQPWQHDTNRGPAT
jgi:phenylacetate-coenzyme A ligase PaaK-like adenylate-forming protein